MCLCSRSSPQSFSIACARNASKVWCNKRIGTSGNKVFQATDSQELMMELLCSGPAGMRRVSRGIGADRKECHLHPVLRTACQHLQSLAHRICRAPGAMCLEKHYKPLHLSEKRRQEPSNLSHSHKKPARNWKCMLSKALEPLSTEI